MNTPPVLPSDKPASVSIATKILYATLVVGAIRSALEWPHQVQDASPASVLCVTIFSTIFSFAISLWVIYMMDRGGNWALITFLVCFIIGVPMAVLQLIKSLSSSPASGVLGLLQVVLQTAALFMLFSQAASPWFRQAAPPLENWVVPSGRSSWAVAAGYLGLISVLLVTAPVALVVSIIAVRHIQLSKASGAPLGGLGRAIFGLVMGTLGTLFLAGLALGVIR